MNLNMKTNYQDGEKYCETCSGSGKLVGNGYIKTNCSTCNGRGKVKIPVEVKKRKKGE